MTWIQSLLGDNDCASATLGVVGARVIGNNCGATGANTTTATAATAAAVVVVELPQHIPILI